MFNIDAYTEHKKIHKKRIYSKAMKGFIVNGCFQQIIK